MTIPVSTLAMALAVVACLASVAVGVWIGRAHLRRTSAPFPVAARPSLIAAIARSRYEIQRDGVVYWHGDDPLLAKQWWEAAKHEPPQIALAFLENGVLRDRRIRTR